MPCTPTFSHRCAISRNSVFRGCPKGRSRGQRTFDHISIRPGRGLLTRFCTQIHRLGYGGVTKADGLLACAHRTQKLFRFKCHAQIFVQRTKGSSIQQDIASKAMPRDSCPLACIPPTVGQGNLRSNPRSSTSSRPDGHAPPISALELFP